MMAAAGTGRVVVPQLVMRIGDGPELEPPPSRELEIPEDVRQLLVHSLERVVSDGTGRRARIRGVQVAGKTGTAQNPHGEDHALFGAFAPSKAPEIAVAVVIENIGHGGEFAAPVAREILEAYFNRKGEAEELVAGD
jgi:penicillin-binding protein 2